MYWRNSNFQIVCFIVGKCHTADEAYRVLCELREDRNRAISFSSDKPEAIKTPEYEQAIREKEFIDKLIVDIQPFRKYADLPDYKAHQICQREEWKLRLTHRGITFMMSSGTIPQDHLETMMCHPDFLTYIAPQLEIAAELQKKGQLTLSYVKKFKNLCLPDNSDKPLEISNDS